ncbi:MAG: hypothetical protein U9N44_04960, partial [Chloroflexota bacterium]|nr:hypothetical protein [Chloroflexota bacterium]
IVMVILAILAGVVVMAVGGVFSSAHEAAYNAVKDDIQNSVVAYATDHNGTFPYNTSNALDSNANCSTCYVLDFTLMLTANGGMLREVPDGCFAKTGADNDNCDSASIAGCDAANHYIWGADQYGNVYSFCDNSSTSTDDCTTNNSGFQGVWP